MKNTPYPYQSALLEKIDQFTQTSTLPVVLAASCGSGKTFMSIYFAERYLKVHPEAKILVLTHGQTILRSQYHENLKIQDPAFSYKEITKGKDLAKYYSKKQVFITLPQTLKGVPIPKFDLVIVDEAHQFYFAIFKGKEGLVPKIIKQAAPQHQLLLTGTPSPFIARNTPTKKEFNILTLPMSRLLEEGAITDVLVELASTTYPISGEDYNQTGNLVETFKFEDMDTVTTLDKLLEKIHKRLKSVVKNNPTVYSAMPKLFDWVSTLKSLEKTMFACHSQEQARQVAKYFTDKGINVALSTSDDDLEAEQVDRFVNEKDCAVLIVVGRGVLGFNFEELVNVVDMTGSQNIDRIFQLMARVVRKHPKGYKKLFFKIVPKTMASYFEHLMTGVLCLTCEEWYTKYNGHNFLQLPLPIRKVNKISGTRTGKGNKGLKQKPKPVEYVGLPAIQLFNDITHKDNSEFNSYEWTTLGKVQEIFNMRDRKFAERDVSVIKEKLLNLAKSGAAKPKYESELGKQLYSLLYPKITAERDNSWRIEVRNIRPDWFKLTKPHKKEEMLRRVRKYVAEIGHLPISSFVDNDGFQLGHFCCNVRSGIYGVDLQNEFKNYLAFRKMYRDKNFISQINTISLGDLTPIEKEIVTEVLKNKSNKEIAKERKISTSSISRTYKRILERIRRARVKKE